jgi:site-specific DNA-methyltransferase (adenine-specific)
MLSATRGRNYGVRFQRYGQSSGLRPLFLCGDALTILRQLPPQSIACCVTSPPYWGHRQYGSGTGIGQEDDYHSYVSNLAAVFGELKRVLKDTGSAWLNLGDTYQDKRLLGVPWRVVFALTDQQGWIVRNDVIWNKIKGGPDNSVDKLRNVHEHIFHLVKQKSYFYNADAIRSTPRSSRVQNGAVISATGVSGVRYKRQIELSAELTAAEKAEARAALEQMLQEIEQGRLADFRMIIRGRQRTTHSDAEKVSGRARELRERGFYFLRYHPKGSKPSDVWDILPEDTQRRTLHFAPFPEDVCKIPILATCPADGIVLDPFCGTGTANLVAYQLQRKSLGIDNSAEYLRLADQRCRLNPMG